MTWTGPSQVLTDRTLSSVAIASGDVVLAPHEQAHFTVDLTFPSGASDSVRLSLLTSLDGAGVGAPVYDTVSALEPLIVPPAPSTTVRVSFPPIVGPYRVALLAERIGSDDYIDLQAYVATSKASLPLNAGTGSDPQPPPTPPTEYDPAIDGFQDYWSLSVAETIALGYQYVTVGARVQNLRIGNAQINSGNGFDAPWYPATVTDGPRQHNVTNRPPFTITNYPPAQSGLDHVEGTMSIRLPNGIILDYIGTNPRDANGAITSCLQVNGFNPAAGGGFSGPASSMDPASGLAHTNNRGIRAGGSANWAGALHHDHFANGVKPGKLVAALGNNQLSTGPIAPARFQDGNASSSYTGLLKMGTQFCLPASFDEDASLSSDAAKVLAVCLRDEGAVVMDRSSTGPTFYATPESQPDVATISSAEFLMIRNNLILLDPV